VNEPRYFRLQACVFALVAAAFTNIYITQPILPILETEFGSDTVTTAFTVSAVLLGIALANLPFGWLADHVPIRPLIAVGGLSIALAGLICAATDSINILIAARFCQGVFIPALTTCLAAYLARTVPLTRLNVVMGSYVAATLLGGMFGRLLGGWVHPPEAWRGAFISAALLVVVAVVVALTTLPKLEPSPTQIQPSYRILLRRGELWLAWICGAAGQAIFSPVFNYMPYRLSETPFNYSTAQSTLLYLVYLVGIVMAPGAGRIANRYGSGNTLIAGSGMLALSLCLMYLPSALAITLGLLGVCAGFFTIHAAAVGSLNRRLTGGQGRANALYVFFYYLGAWFGVTWAGFAYQLGGWNTLLAGTLALVTLPFAAGCIERRISTPDRTHSAVA
jgi:MFS transporter, YNFM family, putative membrane transport protein